MITSDAVAAVSSSKVAPVAMRILRAAFEDVLLVDATYPRQRLAGHDGPTILVAAPDFHPNPTQLGFFRRFRQSGGHLPLFGLDDADVVDGLSRAIDAAKPRNLVIHTECEPTRWMLELVKTTPAASLLVRVASGTSCAALGQSGQLSFVVRQNDVAERYELVVARRRVAGIAERAREILGAYPETFTDHRSAGCLGGIELAAHELEIRLSPVGAASSTRTINAGCFVHDGARCSEGDTRYSWLWVDRARHLRVILGAIPVRRCTVKVVAAKVVDPRNLEAAQLLLNGERLPTRCEHWGDHSGTIISEIVPAEDGVNVLGIAFPKARAVDDGGTVLSACIDQIEIIG